MYYTSACLILYPGNISLTTGIWTVNKPFNSPELIEQELIKGCIKKDATCQRMLFEQFAGKMMSVCLRYAGDRKEAEDILQESFIKIFVHIDQYRFEGALEGWIKRIVVNCALRLLQRKKIGFSAFEENEQEELSIEAAALTNMNADDLLKLISHLPEGYRIVFNLYVLEGYDHNEIAKMLNISAVTSRTQLLKARKMLQNQVIALQKLPGKYA